MVNDLRDLMRSSALGAPSDDVDVVSVVATGRRRVRTRRRVLGAGGATLAAAAVVGAVVLAGGPSGDTDAAGQRQGMPPSVGTVVRLSDARPAVEGVDYDLLTTHVVKDLESEPSAHVTGVTNDGKLVLAETNTSAPARVTLIDPSTGVRDKLPRGPVSQAVELGEERLVFTALAISDGAGDYRAATVFDRTTRTWSRVTWPGLPPADAYVYDVVGMGPDDRVYLSISRGETPRAPELWSASLTDPTDVRNEGLPGAYIDLTDGVLTWTDSYESPTGALHVRDLATGEQIELDVPGGDVCDTLVDRRGDLIALTQRCGDDGGPDDRVVILDASGEPLATIRGSGFGKAWIVGSGVVLQSGDTYFYDTDSGELVLLDRRDPLWNDVEPVPDGLVLWGTSPRDPNDYSGTFHLARWRG